MSRGCYTKEQYATLRRELREYGVNKFKRDMTGDGVFVNGRISNRKNPFAQIVSGQNREENDMNWDNDLSDKASMSMRHKFLCPRDDRWITFNVLTFGISDDHGERSILECINMLDEMEDTAIEYTRTHGWSDRIGLYFHCYPFNSIQTLHLHIVDLAVAGPSLYSARYNNLPLYHVRSVLEDEMYAM